MIGDIAKDVDGRWWIHFRLLR